MQVDFHPASCRKRRSGRRPFTPQALPDLPATAPCLLRRRWVRLRGLHCARTRCGRQDVCSLVCHQASLLEASLRERPLRMLPLLRGRPETVWGFGGLVDSPYRCPHCPTFTEQQQQSYLEKGARSLDLSTLKYKRQLLQPIVLVCAGRPCCSLPFFSCASPRPRAGFGLCPGVGRRAQRVPRGTQRKESRPSIEPGFAIRIPSQPLKMCCEMLRGIRVFAGPAGFPWARGSR